MLNFDDTATYSILAGVFVLLLAVWLLWIAAWLRRIELRADAEKSAASLGLTLLPEGWGPELRAADATRVVRWRISLTGRVRVQERVGKGRWTELPL